MSSLRSAFETPEAKRRYVRRLFATVADRYDLITRLLSYGRDRHWKATLVARAAPRGRHTLDLACGTGDIAFLIAAEGGCVVGLDVVPRMVELARRKRPTIPRGSATTFVVGDMMSLPFPPESFDLVTTGYGLRNVPLLDQALGEAYRVLRPGGRLFALDFDRPASAPVRAVYLTYLSLVGSVFGLALHGDPDTYRYIAASLRRYPGAAAVSERMRRTGFRDANHLSLLGGLMAINHGTK